jgi:hypothetical protein
MMVMWPCTCKGHEDGNSGYQNASQTEVFAWEGNLNAGNASNSFQKIHTLWRYWEMLSGKSNKDEKFLP